MGPDLTLEVIYLNNTTDFKMEFELCGCCNVRFLSHLAPDRATFLNALSKSIVRSRVVVAIGSFNPLDKDYLPKIIAKATGYTLKTVDKEKFAIISKAEYSAPDTAIPLVSESGMFGGCVLENNDQSIIMLTGERALRHSLVSQLVCPYLKLFSGKKSKIQESQNNSAGALYEASNSVKEEINVDNGEENREDTTNISTTFSFDSDLKDEKGKEAEDAFDDKAEYPLNSDTSSAAAVEVVEKTDIKGEENTGFVVLEQPEAENIAYNLEDFLIGEEEYDKKNKKRVVKAIVSVVLVGAVLLSAYFGYEYVYQPMQYRSVINTAHELYGQIWTKLPDNILYKFGKLYQTNNDVIGWLSVPNTSVSLPVVSAMGKTNYYRTHLFEGSASKYGTPYTTSKIEEDTYSRNIVIYGKADNDISVFSGIQSFLDEEQYMSAPVITFDTLYVENKWKIFSVFTADNDSGYDDIQTAFFDDSEFLEYAIKLKSRSVIDTNIDIIKDDELLTLVAEEEEKNVYLVCRKVRTGEAPLVDFSNKDDNQSTVSQTSSAEVSSDDSSAILEEISSTTTSSKAKNEEDNADENVADNGSSRYEQEAPISSAMNIKPTESTISTADKTSSAVSSEISSLPVSSEAVSSEVVSSEVASSESSSLQASSGIVTSQESSQITSSVAVTSSGTNSTVKLPTLTVKNSFTGLVVSAPADEIIAQVIEAEMGSGYHIEALKAQAVAVYSWLLCNGASSGKTPTVPLKTPGEKATQAASAVAGVVAIHNGSIAQTYYYAISAGHTANSSDVWNDQIPYLVSVDSSVDKNADGYQTIRKYSSADVAVCVKDALGVDLTKISDKNSWFKCTYDENGVYVKTVDIGGVVKKGTYLRSNLFTATRVGAANVLRSSAYTISYSASEDKFTFTVKGYGHGVGMSQVGANAYAKNGWTYEQILKHYFTGISLGMYTE